MATKLPACCCGTLGDALCPIHGDVRDTGFVIDSKDDYITAIEDAIEELNQEQERQARLIAAAPTMATYIAKHATLGDTEAIQILQEAGIATTQDATNRTNG